MSLCQEFISGMIQRISEKKGRSNNKLNLCFEPPTIGRAKLFDNAGYARQYLYNKYTNNTNLNFFATNGVQIFVS